MKRTHRRTSRRLEKVDIPVLLEPIAGDGYRARGPEPLALTADGSTPEIALKRFQQLLQERLAAGLRIVAVPVPQTKGPLARYAGTLQAEDSLVQSWEESMAEYRRKVDTDPDYL
jgi:hypothetical protein